MSAQAHALETPQLLQGALTLTEAGGTQFDPSVAVGGQGSLAVWIDHRSEFNHPLANQGGASVYARRLDAAGQPLDQQPLRLPVGVGDKSLPKAAWNGSAWLVIWENQQPLASSTSPRLLLGARISGGGVLLDQSPIVVKDDMETTAGTTAVASNGTDWVVIAQGTAFSSGSIVAVRVSAAGIVQNPGGTQVANISSQIFRPDLEHVNGTYLLVYASGGISGLRFNQSLAALGGTFVIGAGSGGKPRVTSDGTDFLVVHEQAFGASRSVRARRISSATGAMSATVAVTPETNGNYSWDPDVAWSQGNWMVCCRNSVDSTYRAARISPQLSVLDFGGVVLPIGTIDTEGRCRLAATPGGVTAVFEQDPQTQLWPGEILAAHVSDTLTAAMPVTLSRSAPRQGFPALARGRGQYLTAFVGEQRGTNAIQVQRLDDLGQSIDAEPITLASDPRYQHPAVAWNGTVFMVVWEDPVVPAFETDDLVLGMRVGPDGRVLDSAPFVVMGGTMPDIAAQDGIFLVVSSDAPNTYQQRFPFARRLDGKGGAGGPLGPTVQLAATFSRWPHVAPLATGWVVTWQRNLTHDSGYSVAEATHVAANGTPSPSVVVSGSPTFGGASRPTVASANDTALIVWQDNQLGLAGSVMQSNGQLQAAFAIAPLPAKPSLPVVTWNGSQYLVAWQDARNRVGLWDRRLDVFAARVTETGTLLDGGGGFAVAATDETESTPSLAGIVGDTLIAYTTFEPQSPWATLRVAVRRCAPTWSGLGHALAGTHGLPQLVGSGTFTATDPGVLSLTNALENTAAVFVWSLGIAERSMLGGTLVPDLRAPLGLVFAVPTDAAGTFQLTLPSPPGALSGLDFFAQHWILDPNGPFGFSASNAVHGRAP